MQVFEVQNEPFIGSVRPSRIVDSCNGLLCVTGVEEDGEVPTDLIVSFDIAKEVFTLILAPAASMYFIYDNGLAIYENKLAMLSHTLGENFDSSLVELWVMEDDWHWNKRFTSRPHPGLRLLPVTIWKNEIICNTTELPGETKVENAKQQTVMSSNLTTNEFRMFGIRKPGLVYGIFNYAESLVPVGNIHIEEQF
ncbi:hypothetical protein K1719_025834 [Acacia pycnantha]|nr:hypothetical protein K1719_025834 [Acacia pycnantha]